MKDKKMKFLLRNKIWKKGTAWLLVFSIVLETMPVYAQDIAGDIAADAWEEPVGERTHRKIFFRTRAGRQRIYLKVIS